MTIKNIYCDLPVHLPRELFEVLSAGKDFTLERIVSRGQATPEGQWLEQWKNEWVLLLKGSAGIILQGQKDAVPLKPGDYMLIEARQKHRVEYTDKETETVWLALHFQ